MICAVTVGILLVPFFFVLIYKMKANETLIIEEL